MTAIFANAYDKKESVKEKKWRGSQRKTVKKNNNKEWKRVKWKRKE